MFAFLSLKISTSKLNTTSLPWNKFVSRAGSIVWTDTTTFIIRSGTECIWTFCFLPCSFDPEGSNLFSRRLIFSCKKRALSFWQWILFLKLKVHTCDVFKIFCRPLHFFDKEYEGNWYRYVCALGILHFDVFLRIHAPLVLYQPMGIDCYPNYKDN